jgi:hypothetical protein
VQPIRRGATKPHGPQRCEQEALHASAAARQREDKALLDAQHRQRAIAALPVFGDLKELRQRVERSKKREGTERQPKYPARVP